MYEIFRYNHHSYYSDSNLPFVTPKGIKVNPSCTISGAAKIMARPAHKNIDKLGRPKIQYIKAKMTLHKDLTRYEMARLLFAQRGLNGYVKRFGFNEQPELMAEFRTEIIKEIQMRKSGCGTEFEYSLNED